MIEGILNIRAYCTTHDLPAINVGNGKIVFHANDEPREDGWMFLDESEFACPANADNSDCNLEFQALKG